MKKRGRIPKIDDLDLKILELLFEDGRRSLVSIAETVGLTHPSVKERLKRLLDSGLVKIQANINLAKLNLVTGLISAEIGDPRELETVFNNLQSCPRVLNIMYATGEYNIIIIVVASDEKAIRAFVDNNLRNLKSLKKISIANVDIVYPQFLPFRIMPSEECMDRCKDCIFKTKLKLCDGCEGLTEIIKAVKLK